MSGEELISSNKLIIKLRTNIRISQTRPYLPPTISIGNMIPKPGGETCKSVLAETPTGHGICAVRARDDKGKNEEHKEEEDENGHTDQIDTQESLLFPVSTDEAS